MKQLRVTMHVDPERAPTFFALLAESAEVDDARVLDMTTTYDDEESVLLAIDGDPGGFAARATETPGIESVEVSEAAGGRAYALVVMRPLETPVFDAIHRASSRTGLVVRTPIVYRDWQMIARVVGEPAALQEAMGYAPDATEVEIHEVGAFTGGLDDPAGVLSERQREALEAARELGYYDRPREATHEDVAAELDCAPSTASEHLGKAEAKLVDAVLDEFGPDV
jgi:predicted DNA binding protein